MTDTVLEDVTKKWIGSSSKSWEAHGLLRKQTAYERVLEKYELPRMRTDLSRRNNNWADPREWEYLPYLPMGLLLFFQTTGHWRESPRHHSDLHIGHQEFPPQHILITYLWSYGMCREDLEICSSDLPSRTLHLVARNAASGQSSASRASGGAACM